MSNFPNSTDIMPPKAVTTAHCQVLRRWECFRGVLKLWNPASGACKQADKSRFCNYSAVIYCFGGLTFNTLKRTWFLWLDRWENQRLSDIRVLVTWSRCLDLPEPDLQLKLRTFPQLTFPLLQLSDDLLHLWRNRSHMNRQHRSDAVDCLEVMSCIQQQRPGPSSETCDQWIYDIWPMIYLDFPGSGWNSFRHATFLELGLWRWHMQNGMVTWCDMLTCAFLEQGENPDFFKEASNFCHSQLLPLRT